MFGGLGPSGCRCTCGDHVACQTGVEDGDVARVMAWPLPQTTKSVPFGWKAAVGMPQLPGLLVDGIHGPLRDAE